jgi:glycosyltransferase involved in cell wall biosynthesis
MRIGIMLRAYDRSGGVGIYSRNIVKHLLKIDQKNQYVLIYNNFKFLGIYSNRPNVEEVFIPSANPFIWDQWYVTKLINKMGIEIIFHTKFSIPVMTKAKKVMVLHGSGWLIHPHLWNKYDVMYQRYFAMPLYCSKSDLLISNSDLTKRDFVNVLGVNKQKIHTIHLAAGEEFQQIKDREYLLKIKNKYKLPDRFILTVTSYEPRKNFSTLLKAFLLCREKTDIHLVVVGKNCERYMKDYNLGKNGLEEFIHFPGWIEQMDLPAIYNLAQVFVFPSVYEAFGIPVIESMACGCPIVSSNTGAIPELTKDAALLSEPFDFQNVADKVLRILLNDSISKEYKNKGLERAKSFSWSIAADKTLSLFHDII